MVFLSVFASRLGRFQGASYCMVDETLVPLVLSMLAHPKPF